MIDILEDMIMFSACFLKRLAVLIIFLFISSYLLYADPIFSSSIVLLGFLYLGLSYLFYIKSINSSRDVLLNALEKKGRKELQIEDSAESIKLAKKITTCDLPTHPSNAKEFKLTILYLGKDYLTIYSECPKSHIYKIHKKKNPGDLVKKPIKACAKSQEYYYSYIQSVQFNKDILLTLNSGETITIESAKKAAKATVVKIRKYLREAEKSWIGHSRGSHSIKRYD